MDEDIRKMTGQSNFGGGVSTSVKVDVINLTKGKFYRTFLTEPKVDKMYRSESLGEAVNIVFLKIRRSLSEYKKDEGSIRNTTEHNTKNDMVAMFGEGAERATAAALKERYPGLKTTQHVYALLIRGKNKPEVVKVNVRGLSLGSFDEEVAPATKFFAYLNSFDAEHIHEFITRLTVGEEETEDFGEIKHMLFEKMAKLPADKIATVVTHIKSLYEQMTEADKQFEGMKPGQIGKGKKEEFADSTIEYPDEEINPDDIPF